VPPGIADLLSGDKKKLQSLLFLNLMGYPVLDHWLDQFVEELTKRYPELYDEGLLSNAMAVFDVAAAFYR